MSYKDPKNVGSLGGVREYALSSKKTVKKAREDLRAEEAYTLYAPTRRRFPRQKIVGWFINELHVADLAEVFQYPFFPEHNGGTKYLLVIVDTLSRKCWLRALKDKRAATVCSAFKEIYLIPRNRCDLLLTDRGKEFEGACNAFYKEYCINHYHTHSSEIKGSHAERKILDVKRALTRYMHAHNTHEYVKVLPDIERNLNSRRHRILGMSPLEVNALNESEIYARSIKSEKRRALFSVGDAVRISRVKAAVGEKSHRGGWTLEIYKVSAVNVKNPVPSYDIVDCDGEAIEGKFYNEELQKVEEPEFYPVDKILKTKKVGKNTRYLVTFRGYSGKPAWVNDIKKV